MFTALKPQFKNGQNRVKFMRLFQSSWVLMPVQVQGITVIKLLFNLNSSKKSFI